MFESGKHGYTEHTRKGSGNDGETGQAFSFQVNGRAFGVKGKTQRQESKLLKAEWYQHTELHQVVTSPWS